MTARLLFMSLTIFFASLGVQRENEIEYSASNEQCSESQTFLMKDRLFGWLATLFLNGFFEPLEHTDFSFFRIF